MPHTLIGRRCRSSSKAARLLVALLPAAALGAATLGTPSPATQPTAKPVSIHPSEPPGSVNLPPSMAILTRRSIFARNGMAAIPPGTNPQKPEATIALRGIVFDDNDFVVFLEDTAAHRTMQLRPGDPLAGGRIGRISLEEFGYEADGAVTQVRVGQNLLGMTLPPMSIAPPTTAPGPGGPPGGPPEAQPPKGPIYEIAPNGQRIRNLAKERAG